MPQNVFIFIISLLLVFVLCGYFLHEIRRLKRMNSRLKHEHVCRLLHIDGYPTRVDYSQLPALWQTFRNEDPDRFVFVDAASKAIITQVKRYPSFEKVVEHFTGFDLVITNTEVKKDDRELVWVIHKKVAEMTISKVATLAQAKCHRIRLLPKSAEKTDLEKRFKQEISLKAFSGEFFHDFTFEFFMGKEKSKLLDGRAKKLLDSQGQQQEPRVVDLKGGGAKTG